MQAIVGKHEVSAVILAGGRGSRLQGQDKGLVKFQHKPFIEHVLARLQPQVATCVISANRHVDQYQHYGFPVITDSPQGYLGPLAGIFSALQQCSTEWLLSVPCDSPFISTDMVATFIYTQQQQPHHTYVASINQRMQPVFNFIHVSQAAQIQSYLKQEIYKVGYVMRQQQAIMVDFSQQKKHFTNLNTIEDIQIASNMGLSMGQNE